MSFLAHFKSSPEVLNKDVKALIFDHGSRRLDCVCCGHKKFGLLIRHIEPKKIETLICHECFVILSLGMTIDVGKDSYFGLFSPKKIIATARKRGSHKAGAKNTEKVQCPHCDKMVGAGAGLANHIRTKHPDVIQDSAELIEPEGNLTGEPLYPILQEMENQSAEPKIDGEDDEPVLASEASLAAIEDELSGNSPEEKTEDQDEQSKTSKKPK